MNSVKRETITAAMADTKLEGCMEIAAIIVGGVLVLTGMAFIFANKIIKADNELSKMKMQKEILELEVQKQHNHLQLLEEENKKYDKIINVEQ